MEHQIQLLCRVSKNGKRYIALVCDLGYCEKALAFGSDALEIMGYSPREVANVEPGDVIASGVLTSDSGTVGC